MDMHVNLFPEGNMRTASKGRAVAAAAADLLREFDERARQTIVDATADPMVRKRYEKAGVLNRLHHARREDGPRGIYAFLRDLADMSSCGVPEHAVRGVAAHVHDFLDELFPVATDALPDLDIVEQELEGQANALATRRMSRGLTPAELEAEAQIESRHAEVERVRSRVLRFAANEQRFGQAQAGRA